MPSLVRWIVLSLLALSTGLHAEADKKVREIVIRSYHNGLAEVQTKDGSVGCIDRSGKYVWGPSKRNDPTE
jgi:hypothetical protein